MSDTKESTESNPPELQILQDVEWLDDPLIKVTEDGATLRILELGEQQVDEVRSALGYISTKSGRAIMLGEFSGVPNGRSRPAIAVKGFVGKNNVYKKNIYADMLHFSGLRTAIAQRRAAKSVKARLK